MLSFQSPSRHDSSASSFFHTLRNKRRLWWLFILIVALAAISIVFDLLLIHRTGRKWFWPRSHAKSLQLKHVPGLWPPSRSFLDKIADAQGRVTVVGVNSGYMDMFQLWLERAQAQGVRNHVIMAYDQETYQSLQGTGRAVFPLAGCEESRAGATAAFDYNSADFNQLTRTRPALLKPLLDLGYTVFYSDIDTAYRRNPYEVFDEMLLAEPELDLIVSGDGCASLWCSCLLYLRPRPKTTLLMETWLAESQVDSSVDDQMTLNQVKDRLAAAGAGLRHGLVPDWVFPSGKTMFKNANYDWDRHPEGPAVVHANWMTGHDLKLSILRNTTLWDRKP